MYIAFFHLIQTPFGCHLHHKDLELIDPYEFLLMVICHFVLNFDKLLLD